MKYSEQQIEHYNEITADLLAALPSYVLSYVNSKMDHLGYRTRCGYVQDIAVFFHWLKNANSTLKDVDIRDIPLDVLDSLTADDLDEYMGYLTQYTIDGKTWRNSPTSKARKLSSLRSFYLFLNKRSKISHNPAALVETPQIPKKDNVRVLSQEERDELYNIILKGTYDEGSKGAEIHDVLAKRDYAIVILFLGSGLRISELAGIDLNDINFVTGQINVIRKGASFNHIFVNGDVLDALEEYIYECRDRLKPNEDAMDALFLSRKHNRMSTRSIQVMLKKYTDALWGDKHGITPHKLRATYGTQVQEEFNDIFLTATVMNHKSTDVTAQRYLNKKEESLIKASTINVFGERNDHNE